MKYLPKATGMQAKIVKSLRKSKKCQASVNKTSGLLKIQVNIFEFGNHLYLFSHELDGFHQLPRFLKTLVSKWNCKVSIIAFETDEINNKTPIII